MINSRPDIVMFALPRWDQPISSPALSLAKEFAKEGRVFYIEHPFSLKDIFHSSNTSSVNHRKYLKFFSKKKYDKLSDAPEGLTIVYPSVTIPTNFLPNNFVYRGLNKFNDWLITRSIRQLVRDFGLKNYIYFNSYDPFFLRSIPKSIAPSIQVYQSMDDISQEDYTAKHGLRLENEIVSKSDIVLTTGTELLRLKQKYNPNTWLLPNAADITLFGQALDRKFEKPQELKHLSGKIIGFTGSVEYRTDFELLMKLFDRFPAAHFVFVGPVFAPEVKDLGLLDRPNIHFLGSRKIEELPKYLQFMDVVLIPYKCNTLTRSIYPLKINEYLGAGKSVVATSFSEDIRSFKKVAFIAENHDEFIRMVEEQLETTSSVEVERARYEVASQNTWAARVKKFWEIVSEFQNRRNST